MGSIVHEAPVRASESVRNSVALPVIPQRGQLRGKFVGQLLALAQHRIENIAAPFGVAQRFLVARDAALQFGEVRLAARQRRCLPTRSALRLPVLRQAVAVVLAGASDRPSTS